MEETLKSEEDSTIFSFEDSNSQDQLVYSDAQEYHIAKKEYANGGIAFTILRWPLILFIGLFTVFELFLYSLVRLWVWIYETSTKAMKGMQYKKQRSALDSAKDLQEWRNAALQLDETWNKEEWKRNPESKYYDVNLIKTLKRQLDKFQTDKNIPKLADTMYVACRNNAGGIENEQLYSHTYYGTKYVVKHYINQVTSGLDCIYNSDFPMEEKRKIFKKCSKSYGKTALCLSGGATMSFYHLGVVKCLLEQHLLPQVISGTSGGALIACLVCTRNDKELLDILNSPEELVRRINAMDEPNSVMIKRMFTKGVLFDHGRWVEKMQWISKGPITFLEAYQQTGRILNITVIPTEKHAPPMLLNYKTTPNVVIYSAVLASASIPLLVEPAELLYKKEDGTLEPYYLIGKNWRDGSFKTDIPVKPLHRLFNVNYTIVSQMNPHIAFFFFENRGSSGAPSLHRKGAGWRGGFIISSIEHYLKLDMLKWLRFLRALDLLPHVLGADGSFLFLQRFNGTVTIVPKPRFKDYCNLVAYINEEKMSRFMRVGEKITWPKLCMIENRMKIEERLINYTRVLNGEQTSTSQSK